MRDANPRLTVAAAALCALLVQPVAAQYREYYVRGKVVDEQRKPVADVAIDLVDPSTSRRYNMKTNEKGEFKFAGLPHAKYEVTYSREGYSTVHDEWDFAAPQDRMQRVDVPDVVLPSGAHVAKVERLAGARAGVDEAAEKIRAGDLDGAIAAALKVLEKSPDDPNALFYLGLSRAGKKEYAEAVGPLLRVTELTPEFPGAWFELGICYQGIGEPEKALDAYDRNLELDPANANSAYNAGLMLFEQNRIEEALARFEGGLAAKPDDPDLNDMAGRCYLHDAKIDLALAHLEKARGTTTDPDKQAFLDSLIDQAKVLVR